MPQFINSWRKGRLMVKKILLTWATSWSLMCQEPLPGVRTQQLPRRRDLGCITWSSPSLLQMTSQRSTHLSTCLCSPEKFKFLQPQLSEHKLSAPSLSASLLSQGHCWIPEQETNSVTSDSIPLNLVFPLPLQVLNSSAIYQTWTITIHLMQKNRHETSSQHGKMETSFRMVSHAQLLEFMSDSLWPHGLYSPPGSSVHGILQARISEWVATPSSRGSSRPRDRIKRLLSLLHWQVGSLPLVPQFCSGRSFSSRRK